MNPFHPVKIPNPWGTPRVPDVPGIYRNCQRGILEHIDAVRLGEPKRQRILLLLGDEGIGKTHFLTQLYEQAKFMMAFTCCSPPPSVHRIYRDLLAQMTGDLGRLTNGSLDQLTSTAEKALCRSLDLNDIASFVKQAQDDPRQMRHAISDTLLNIQTEYPEANSNILAKFLALPFLNVDLGEQIRWWLSGTPLREEAMNVLRINFEISTESRAREALLTLDAMHAYSRTPLVIAYDPLENLSKFPDAANGLAQFIGDMNTNSHSILSVISARPEVYAEFLQPLLDTHFDDTPRNVLTLPTPSRVQALAIVRAKVGSSGLSPLNEDDVYASYHGSMSPGEMLGSLARTWQERVPHNIPEQTTLGMVAIAPNAGENAFGISEEKTVVMRIVENFEDEEEDREPVSKEWSLQSLESSVANIDSTETDPVVWEALDEQLEQILTNNPEANFDFEDSLPAVLMAISALGQDVTTDLAISGLPRDIMAVLRHHDAPLILAQGNHSSGNAFAYRIRWLLKQTRFWLPKEPDFRGIILRDTERKIPQGWKKGRAYVEELEDLGGQIISVNPRDRAILKVGYDCLEQGLELEVDRLRTVMGLPTWPALLESALIRKLLPPAPRRPASRPVSDFATGEFELP